MRDVEAPLAAAGTPLFLIGNGEPRHVPAFRAATRTTAEVSCDPKMVTFRAAGLERGVLHSVRPGALVGGVRALLAGHGFGGVKGDPWQQGGALVLSPAGEVRLHQVSRHVADLVTNRELLIAAGVTGSKDQLA